MSSEERFPLNGTFELTGRCNLSCKMCLVRVDGKRICEIGERERTAQEWINMAEQVRDAGTFSLLLTGGEVLLRPDFCEIYEAVSQMGFILTVYTNATMVTDKVMDLFRKLPPHKIGVTMYGASNETYEKMCGCADGYDRFVEGVEKLRTLPSLFDIRTTIIQDNLADLPAMREFVKKEFGEEHVLTISRFVADKVRGSITDPRSCRLTPEQNIELVHSDVAKIAALVQAGKMQIPDSMEKFEKKSGIYIEEGRYLFEHCKAGMESYAISWDGKMYACELLAQGYTEPFKDGFEEAWKHLPEQYPRTSKIEKCSTCEYAGTCEVCPATRLAETGEWFGVPEYTCREAQRMQNLLREAGLM